MFSGLANFLFGSTNSDAGNISKQENENQFENEDQNLSQNYQTHDKNNKPIDDDLKFLSIETDEDDWLIVDKDEEESLPRTDSEEELPFIEIKKSPKTQRPRNHYYNRAGSGGQYNSVHLTNPNQHNQQLGQNDGTTQSLFAVPSNALAIPTNNIGTVHLMEESWFLTPPPCFTSTGPVNMETSPFENLLIEHPSMSVYHSIRTAQEAAESFVNLDLAIDQPQNPNPIANRTPVRTVPVVVQQRNNNNNRADQHLTNQEVKQNLLLRNSQKLHEKNGRYNNNRGAIKRGNKVRDVNSKNGRQRRSDQQHCKIISGANNNRKC